MKNFEHRFIIAEKAGKGVFGFIMPRDISWKVHYVNGRQQKDWTEVTLYNYLDKVGAEGWEVSAMSNHMSIRSGTLPVEHLYVVLKKEKG